ncbi:TerC/Alx family metal homeostasis membrane protein [Streptoalloteichus hindustanus]|nr:TerC/Alx family metal homeostasis membrane protein [Streptoalloteichus hindustanus]
MAEPALAQPVALTGPQSVASPLLWAVTILGLVLLLALDFALTHRPHEVSMREAVAWSAFYLVLPLAFGAYLWFSFGSGQSVEFLTGYLVEKSLSVDNLFVFILLLSTFAVPPALAQRVLLYGIVGALVLRGVFIALGAAMLQAGTWAFLVFGAVLLVTAARLLRDTVAGREHEVDITQMRSVRLLRRLMPVTREYHGTRMVVRVAGRRTLTPLALAVVAVFATDIVFAVDSVPAVYGITEDPFLVFATNAFALLGLRALYFVLQAALTKLAHLDFGLAMILLLIGGKLVLHWAHDVWPWVPEIPTLLSLAGVVLILLTVTLTSLWANRRADARRADGDRTPRAEVSPPGERSA